MPFSCSICEEESTRICARCTKDACDNHLCEKCLRCSDCCECEVTLSEPVRTVVAHAAAVAEPVFEPPVAEPAPLAEEPLPVPEPAQPESPWLPATPTEPRPQEAGSTTDGDVPETGEALPGTGE